MNRPMQAREQLPPSRVPSEGWHCSHFFISSIVQVWKRSPRTARRGHSRSCCGARSGRKQCAGAAANLDRQWSQGGFRTDADGRRSTESGSGPPAADGHPTRQLFDSHLFIRFDERNLRIRTHPRAVRAKASRGREEEGSATYQTKLKAYEQREVHMRKQRLTPVFPEWPVTCFYPMNKSRRPGANWFTLPASERHALMTEHGRTGMQFAGRVTQLITVSVGLDDWEWGVTLWASNPEYLKEIVYRMRFDEASAKYAEFGPFYTSYISSPEEMFAHCRITS